MTKLEFLDKISDILVGLNTLESDLLGSLYDELMRDAGWHPASELPSVDDAGDSEWLVVILMNNEILCASYNSRHEGWYREDGSKIYGVIKRWCYLPKED